MHIVVILSSQVVFEEFYLGTKIKGRGKGIKSFGLKEEITDGIKELVPYYLKNSLVFGRHGITG